MNIAIVGSRDYHDLSVVEAAVDKFVADMEITIDNIVSGGANGVDRLAERYAAKRGLPCHIFYADWKRHGKRAGYLRNIEIVKNSDYVFAFWDGTSKGTGITISLCKKENVPCQIVNI